MTSKRAGVVLLTALMLVSSPALAQPVEYNVVRGTDCNDWSDGHNHTPENDRCNRPDLEGTGGPDKFLGSLGWDYQTGGRGNDLMYGGPGMEQGYGGQGDDRCIYGPGHDHCWTGDGDDLIDLSDGRNESDHTEEAHGQGGTDTCILDNDIGDEAVECERITVLNNDGSRTTFAPGSEARVPKNVNITVKR